MTVTVRPVASKADKKAFVELAYRLNADDPNWVPPLKDEVRGLITPGKNPWFEHGEAEFFLAERGGRAVGRISAQVDPPRARAYGRRARPMGMFEAEDEEVGARPARGGGGLAAGKGMTRSMGPFSLGIWDEPGLLSRATIIRRW